MACNRQNIFKDDKMCYSEQAGYGRPAGYGMPHHNNLMGVTECQSYTTSGAGYGQRGGYNVVPTPAYDSGSGAGYGQGGGYYSPTPVYNSGSGACFERKEEICMSNSGMGGHHKMRPFGHRRRRVMKHCESRGSYSSSESDSD